jgi:5-oxoprolinase (ATP-hydrolysing)
MILLVIMRQLLEEQVVVIFYLFSFNFLTILGATPNSIGVSGVHTHMTNTRITDIEIIEKRYPVIVQRFTLNPGSGGRGKFNGGDGVIRELLFRKDLVLSVLTERRVFTPYGIKGK